MSLMLPLIQDGFRCWYKVQTIQNLINREMTILIEIVEVATKAPTKMIQALKSISLARDLWITKSSH